jgi:hypothetical protein
VAVTEDDIIRVKAAGNANNDWKACVSLSHWHAEHAQITMNLVHATGQTPSLEEVTEKYERIYQVSHHAQMVGLSIARERTTSRGCGRLRRC